MNWEWKAEGWVPAVVVPLLVIAGYTALVALAALALFGCSYAHSHPRLPGDRCHAHPAIPWHTVHDHDTGPSANFVEQDLYDADGNPGVGVSGSC